MHPSGASRNKEDHAIFSNDGPYLISPALTSKPRVIPKNINLKITIEEVCLNSKLKLQTMEMSKLLLALIQSKF